MIKSYKDPSKYLIFTVIDKVKCKGNKYYHVFQMSNTVLFTNFSYLFHPFIFIPFLILCILGRRIIGCVAL